MSRIARLSGAALTSACLLGLALPVSVLAAPPPNDGRAGAIPVEVGETQASTIVDATTSPDDPPPCRSGDTETRSVWFSFTATASTPVLAVIRDPELAMHVLAPDGATELGCAVSGTSDHVRFDAVEGETYLIEEAALVDDPLIDAAAVGIELQIDLTIDPPTTGRVEPFGGVGSRFVRVSFDITLECPTQPITAAMHLVLEQGSGASKAVARNAEDDNSFTCHPPSYSFDLVVPGNGPDPDANFQPGPATMSFGYTAFTSAQRYDSPTVRSTVQLVGSASTPEVTLPPTSTDAPVSRPSGDAWSAVVGLVALVVLIGGLASWSALAMRRRHLYPPDRGN